MIWDEVIRRYNSPEAADSRVAAIWDEQDISALLLPDGLALFNKAQWPLEEKMIKEYLNGEVSDEVGYIGYNLYQIVILEWSVAGKTISEIVKTG